MCVCVPSYLCPAQDLSVLPMIPRIKFKHLNITLYYGAHLLLQSLFSGLSGPQIETQNGLFPLLEDSSHPS